ncbi:MAG TPA: methionyl-tRNA formyltransferase [Steroidobacteraceae bacterium]|jgi:methionyl-tRNA formyltransferase|nr:methionyl-tRNA formyltransferase [Steroidobacteraceae bacterium]
MKIAIIGQQAFGKSVLEAFVARGDEVAGVFCAPEMAAAKPDPLRQTAQQLGLRLFQLPNLKDAAAATALRSLDVDLAVMAYVLQFAPQEFVSIPRQGTIQYHPSLLPKYRGPSAINWPLIRGDAQTGLTVFRPTDGLDEGPIVLQRTVEVSADDTVATVYFERLFPQGVQAMLEAADLIVTGRHRETAQDESRASYEGWCRDPEARINWHSHVDLTYNLIRGCNPAPGAWTLSEGRKLRIFDTLRHPTRRFADVSGKPGEIVAIGDQGLHIAVLGGRLEILRLRIEGGEKMSGAAYAAAFGLIPGMRIDGEHAQNTEAAARRVKAVQ